MPEVILPESLRDVEVVKSVRTPAQLDYEFTAGDATTRFLKAINQKRIVGQRAPGGRVYVPPRGADPELGQPTPEEVEVAQVGTVTSFCVVNLQFYGSVMEIPYVTALILLDGADLSIMHLIQELPADEVRIGMRVEAVWRDDADIEPTLESIKWFRPTGEPDDTQVRVPGEDRGTGLGSWIGGVAPTEAIVRNPRTGLGGGGLMREVAVISFDQTPAQRRVTDVNEVEMLMPAVHGALKQVDMTIDDIGFTCSGSTDYLAGMAFSFVSTLDAVGPWPPIQESHVEMDGAWAMYEAWVKLQLGEIDTALVYCYAKSSPGDLPMVLTRQLDPILAAPLWPDSISLAALQARALLDSGKATEKDMAEVAARSRRDAMNNPNAQLAWDRSAADVLAEDYLVAPLRKSDCPPITDAAAAIVLAADDAARSRVERPAWIRGIDHRVEPIHLGLRDLTVSESTRIAAGKAGVHDGPVDVAEIHAPFTHQELILREAIGLNGSTAINPSGGALAANPIMTAGLIRVGELASRIWSGGANRGIAHATSGPCLQQNLVCVLEGDA